MTLDSCPIKVTVATMYGSTANAALRGFDAGEPNSELHFR
jgi:hypothetical protein